MGEEEPQVEISTKEEVELETIKNGRPLFQLLITRPGDTLNRQIVRSDRSSLVGTEGFTEFRSFKEQTQEVKRMRMDEGVQSAALTKIAFSQTQWARKVNSSSQTSPILLLPELGVQIQAKDDYQTFLVKIAERVTSILDSNMASDVFSDQLATLAATDASLVNSFSVSQMKERVSLKDARFNNPVQCIDWVPGSPDSVAISFTSTTDYPHYLEVWPFANIEYIFIWSFQTILHPAFVLESPSVVKIFKFCPDNPNIVVGGCENGQVILFDLSDPDTKIDASLRTNYGGDDHFSQFYHPKFSSLFFGPNLQPTKCHTQPVCDLHWLPKGQKFSRIGELDQSDSITQFITCGLEGRIDVWDINIDTSSVHPNTTAYLPGASLISEWTPSFTLNIQKIPKTGAFLPVRLFQFRKDANKNLSGEVRLVTDEGYAASFNWLTGGDRSLASRQNPILSMSERFLFHTPLGFKESPFIDGLFLACDRSHVILASMKNNTQELFRSSARDHPILCIAFSPKRPSVFVVGKENGEIEVWSLLEKSHECYQKQSVSSSKVTSIHFGVGKNDRQLLCIGCGDGSLLVLKVPDYMTKQVPNEQESMVQFVEQQLLFVKQTIERFKVRQTEARTLLKNKKVEEPPAEVPPPE